MKKKAKLAAVAAAIAAAAGVVAIAGGGGGSTQHHLPVSVPVLNPNVTQGSIGTTICVHGWTATIRPSSSVTGPIKRHLQAQKGAYQGNAELDHAVPLELGGATGADGRNLWLEPQPRASVVDKQENALKAGVCRGAISLKDAQLRIIQLKTNDG